MALVDVSDGACRMLGFARDELLAPTRSALGLATDAQLEAPRRAGPGGAAPRPTWSRPSCCAPATRCAVPVEIQLAGGRRPDGRTHADRGGARHQRAPASAQQRLKHLASYDSLTGLPNRTLFYQNLRETIELAQDKDWRVAVLFIALDRFKVVNDSLGAAAGRRTAAPVQQPAGAVRCASRDTRRAPGRRRIRADPDHDARPGRGGARRQRSARSAARAVRPATASRPRLTASIGIAMYPDDATDPDTLVQVRRHRDGARQGGGARRLPLLHGRHERAGAGAARPRAGAARARSRTTSSSCTTSPR